MTSQLPHDHYIDAVVTALADVGRDPANVTLDDCDTRGAHRYLRALLHFTPEVAYGVDQTVWPHGLLLIWKWHTGLEADLGEPERGPVWLSAKCSSDGTNDEPVPLPVPGVANPMQVAFSLAELINTGRAGKRRIGHWACAVSLITDCEAWGIRSAPNRDHECHGRVRRHPGR
ncbi:hypothetical protein [Streptomyces goshikiensis]|uniref:hypothetical protein n=1 Tax=Streptomyces goshikiensis TaxID=1942 RepID=UPI0036C0F068